MEKTLPHIVISGATGGLGQALAMQYAKHGHILSLFGRNIAALASIKEACEKKGALVHCYPIDLLDTTLLVNTLKEIDQKAPVTLAIANAGITSCVGENDELETLDQIHQVIDTNLKGSLSFISPIIDKMQQRKAGQIALIASLAAYKGLPITPAYCASKAGLKTYGDAIRPLLKKHHVYLSVVCPGFIAPGMSEYYPGKKTFVLTPERAAYLIAKYLKKRKPTISFPFPLNLGSWFLGILPSYLADFIVMRSKACHRSDHI